MGEAINGIVKHFHKPEKEVRDGSLDRPEHVVLLFITDEEKLLSALVASESLHCRLCSIIQTMMFENKYVLLNTFSSLD